MPRPLGLLLLTMTHGAMTLIPADILGPILAMPADGANPPRSRVTFRGRAHYEAIEVKETVAEIRELYAELLLEAHELENEA